MRENKFRAWDKINKEMLDVEMFNKQYIGFNTKTSVGSMPRDNGILMQFTGLKDKNGKSIFEGDIVTFNNSIISSNDPNPDLRIVKWDDEYAGFCHAYVDGNCRVSGYSWCKNNAEKMFEIIGNIYENPELIKTS